MEAAIASGVAGTYPGAVAVAVDPVTGAPVVALDKAPAAKPVNGDKPARVGPLVLVDVSVDVHRAGVTAAVVIAAVINRLVETGMFVTGMFVTGAVWLPWDCAIATVPDGADRVGPPRLGAASVARLVVAALAAGPCNGGIAAGGTALAAAVRSGTDVAEATPAVGSNVDEPVVVEALPVALAATSVAGSPAPSTSCGSTLGCCVNAPSDRTGARPVFGV
jgi:hypothetical protein